MGVAQTQSLLGMPFSMQDFSQECHSATATSGDHMDHWSICCGTKHNCLRLDLHNTQLPTGSYKIPQCNKEFTPEINAGFNDICAPYPKKQKGMFKLNKRINYRAIKIYYGVCVVCIIAAE